MGFRCKCRATGKFGNTDDFFRVEHNGKNIYFETEETYKEYMKSKEDRELLLKLLAYRVMNYDSTMMITNAMKSKIKKLNETYPYEVMIIAINDNLKLFQYYGTLSGKFKNEGNRQLYIMSIISEKCIDAYLKYKNQKEIDKTTEQSIGNFDTDLFNSSQNIKNKQIKKKTDISKYV